MTSGERRFAERLEAKLEDDYLLWYDVPRGGSAFLWSYSVVLTGITRSQFDSTALSEVLSPHRVICKDEMVETGDPEAFQARLRAMFPWHIGGALTLPQIDRIRWHLFPEIRILSVADQGQLARDAGRVLPDCKRAGIPVKWLNESAKRASGTLRMTA